MVRKFEKLHYSEFTVREQRKRNAGLELAFSIIQSRIPAHGIKMVLG